MRIVINLPIKMFNRIKSIYGHDRCTGLLDEDRVHIVTEIVNSTPLSKVIGDIKAEVETLETGGDCWELGLKEEIVEIIDKHKRSEEE